MTINGSYSYSKLANTMAHLRNPNYPTGTALIELPADVGRAYSGYKRGGVIEGTERFRKEVMSAIVWLLGIPGFNMLGNLFCEKILKIPMNMDYSGTNGGINKFREIFKNLKNKENINTENIISQGNDSIKDSVLYLTQGIKPDNLDASELKKYGNKFKNMDPDKLIKKIKGAKQITSIAALVINCVLMGIVLPKINQKLTAKKLKEKETQNSSVLVSKKYSMEEFKKSTSKNVSFTGLNNFASVIADWATYGINNSNRFRLISTDVPMIIGRCATARNKYEALEIAFMDTAAIYFYNFCLEHSEKLLQKSFGTPNINPKIGECILSAGKEALNSAVECATNDNEAFSIENLFDKNIVKEIYTQGTNGKYGKINRFVKKEEISDINTSVRNLLKHLAQAKEGETINLDKAASLIKKINLKNTAFYSIGTILSFLGLGILIPKIAYFITKKITGKDGFVGIQEENKK